MSLPLPIPADLPIPARAADLIWRDTHHDTDQPAQLWWSLERSSQFSTDMPAAFLTAWKAAPSTARNQTHLGVENGVRSMHRPMLTAPLSVTISGIRYAGWIRVEEWRHGSGWSVTTSSMYRDGSAMSGGPTPAAARVLTTIGEALWSALVTPTTLDAAWLVNVHAWQRKVQEESEAWRKLAAFATGQWIGTDYSNEAGNLAHRVIADTVKAAQ